MRLLEFEAVAALVVPISFSCGSYMLSVSRAVFQFSYMQ